MNGTSVVFLPVDAIQQVATQLQLGTIQGLQQIERDKNQYIFSDAGIASQNIPVELVYVNQDNSLKLAWDLVIYTKDNVNWWNVRVDALTNEILETHDLILSCNFEKDHDHNEHLIDLDFQNVMFSANSILVDGSSYNVYALPTESPTHGPRQIVNEPASSAASPFGWHYIDGITGAEFTITRGNNVWAKEDTRGINDVNGFAADGTSTLNFDFPLDFASGPFNYQEAAITNLFYTSNMMHDIWFQHGFDEVAGNFQAKNYSGLGNERDFVIADAQDGSGFNNANFGTPEDGFSPRMQMFLWSPPGTSGSDRLNILSGSLTGEYNGLGAAFGTRLSSSDPLTGSLEILLMPPAIFMIVASH